MSNIQAKFSNVSWYSDLILLTVSIALTFGLFLGTRPLSVPDEGRYAEIPREMLVLHDFVTPHLNGVKYFEKPPLFYWLQTGSIKALNPLIIHKQAFNKFKKTDYFSPISEWTVRLPNAIVALLNCLLVYVSGRILFERRTGLLSAIILASSLLYFALARMVTLDMTLSICLSGSLLAFLVAANQSPSLKRRWLFYSAYILAGLAVLTKGLIGILFPIMIIGVWILLSAQWRLLKECYLFSGVLLFLLIVLPWHILVQMRNPEFFQFYFFDQQFLRYSTLIAQRYQPDWFFIPILVAGFLPWVCFLPQAIMEHLPKNWQQFKEKNNSIFLLLWIGIIFLFFSFSHSKLIPYILPIFPALALLTGHYLSSHWQHWAITWGYVAVPLLWLVLGGMGILILIHDPSITLAQSAKHFLIVSYSLFLFTGLIASLYAIKKKPNRAFASLAIGSVVSFFIVSMSIPKLDTRSIKPLVVVLMPLLKPGDRIVSYSKYYQDLPFYLNQRVFTVNVNGELSFGMKHQQETRRWMLKDADFWPKWKGSNHIFMITSRIVYQELIKQKKYLFYLLAKTPQDVLLSNYRIEKNKIKNITRNNRGLENE
jgi:4-amino-4-deoxy-L-arabinose transferase-like glycosyltransferase